MFQTKLYVVAIYIPSITYFLSQRAPAPPPPPPPPNDPAQFWENVNNSPS